MLRRIPTLLALLVIASMILAACGGDDDDGADDTPATATATSPASGNAETTATEAETAPTPTEPAGDDATQPDASDDAASTGGIIEPPERAASIPVNGRVLGDPNAPVAIIEYGDFQ